jgi:hypothetical protein
MVDEHSFSAHIELLRQFLSCREEIVESIESILNAQRKPAQFFGDRPLLSRLFEDFFFAYADAASQTRLRGELEEAHWAAGFRPRQVQHVFNDLIHPAEILIRAFHCWQQTRWPGGKGRAHFAHTLFNLYLLRCLQFLSMRIWDGNPGNSGARLSQIQGLLGELWGSSPANQPAFVRDARWLIPLAQSPITDDLAPYLEVARQVTETLPAADALEIWRAHVRMLGGHLTSQIRYYCTKDGVPINDPTVVRRTRTSNALDFALLVEGLVELLKAYDRALEDGDERLRLAMAGAICQGISPDPELFLNRVGLLSAYTMMEHVFVAQRDGHAVYSPLGQRHVELVKEYGALIERLRDSLREDAPRFKPVDGGYSPYGILFGTPTNLIEHMALKALQHYAETRFGLEDVFEDVCNNEGDGAAKLVWVNGWRELPHIRPEVRRQYDYPQQFAEEIHSRIEHELNSKSDSRIGGLYILSETDRDKASEIPELPLQYVVSSDKQVMAAHRAEPYDQAQLLRDRQEGHFLVSYEIPGGWTALRKDLLTDILGAGRDAKIVGLPLNAAQVLRLMCADVVSE